MALVPKLLRIHVPSYGGVWILKFFETKRLVHDTCLVPKFSTDQRNEKFNMVLNFHIVSPTLHQHSDSFFPFLCLGG